MASLPPLLIRTIIGLLIIFMSIAPSVASAEELSLAVSPNATMRVLPVFTVEKSPGTKPGTKMFCARVKIHGLPRLKHLKKFACSIRVKVSYINSLIRPPSGQVCFHRNMTIGIGMCAQGQWEKLSNGWIRSMSPFDNKFLDIRSAGTEPLEVSLVEEFHLYRVVFLVVGIVLLTLASFLSQSLVFYYGSAMTVGVLLVILVVLFQGMRLLPTGRKSSFAIFMYSSVVGLGSFLLNYASKFLQSILTEIGVGEDMYNPLAIFLVAFLVIAGAWLGFWAVRKLVLTDYGDIDTGVSYFVAWSIRIFASLMILQSSRDPLLAAGAWMFGLIISLVLKKLGRFCLSSARSNRPKVPDAYYSPAQTSRIRAYGSPVQTSGIQFYGSPSRMQAYNSPFRNSHIGEPSFDSWHANIQGSSSKSVSRLSDSDSDSETFYSTYHNTPNRKNFTEDEWDNFTRESTRKAMEGLVSSPEFSRWAVAHADRLTLAPKDDSNKSSSRRNWFSWF